MDSIFKKVNSFSDIVQAMVDGVNKEWVEIDMRTFGVVKVKERFLGLLTKEICYGCAATNTLCELNGKAFNAANINTTYSRAEALNQGREGTELISRYTLNIFETALDFLRTGSVRRCLDELRRIQDSFNFVIPSNNQVTFCITNKLPVMSGKNHGDLPKALKEYQQFADNLRAAGL